MATVRQSQLPDQGSDQFRSSRGRMPRRSAGPVGSFLGSGATSRKAAPAKHSHLEGTTLELDSDLSGDLDVSDQEIEAIARLLGDDLQSFLAKR
jgi:hypothetical protein